MRVAVDKDVPWNCTVFQRHLVKETTGVEEQVAFGIEVEEADRKGYTSWEYASFEEMGMDTFSIGDTFLISEVAELREEVARLWQKSINLVHHNPPAVALKFNTQT